MILILMFKTVNFTALVRGVSFTNILNSNLLCGFFFRMKCVLLRLRVYSFHPIAHSPFSNFLAKFHFYYFWGHIVLPTALSKHRSSLLTQIIRVYSDYPSLLRLSEFTQTIRVYSDYPSSLILSDFTQFECLRVLISNFFQTSE